MIKITLELKISYNRKVWITNKFSDSIINISLFFDTPQNKTEHTQVRPTTTGCRVSVWHSHSMTFGENYIHSSYILIVSLDEKDHVELCVHMYGNVRDERERIERNMFVSFSCRRSMFFSYRILYFVADECYFFPFICLWLIHWTVSFGYNWNATIFGVIILWAIENAAYTNHLCSDQLLEMTAWLFHPLRVSCNYNSLVPHTTYDLLSSIFITDSPIQCKNTYFSFS